MDKFKWIFKWKKDVDGDTIFVPIFVPEIPKTIKTGYFAIWRSGVPNKFVAGWESDSSFKELRDINPSSEDLRMAIEYTFSVNDFFEGF